MSEPTEQDRAVTVEQAIDLFRNYDYSNWYVDAGRILADEVERLQARVAELEKERDELRASIVRACEYWDGASDEASLWDAVTEIMLILNDAMGAFGEANQIEGGA